MDHPAPLARLIESLRRLPGLGPKSAQRIAFHLLRGLRDEAQQLAAAVGELHDGMRTCVLCECYTDQERCSICSDERRTDTSICVVEQPHDVIAIERTRDFKGRYHVLHGVLSPLAGVGPDELRIAGLLERVRPGGVAEVVLALSPTVEGEATSVYLARLIKPLGPRVTRIAMGVPVGSDLEWADDVTLAKAMEGRRDY